MSTTSTFLPSMPYSERKNGKNVNSVPDTAYHIYLYFTFPNDPGAFPLVPSCRCLRSSLQIGRWLWRQSGFTIIHKLGRHIVSTIQTVTPNKVLPYYSSHISKNTVTHYRSSNIISTLLTSSPTQHISGTCHRYPSHPLVSQLS